MKKDWTYKKLGEVAEVIGGSTPKTSEPANWVGSNMWVTPAELDGSKYFGKTQRTISDEAASKLQLLPIGTVLFSSRAPIGYVAIAKNELCTNQGFKSVVVNPEIVDNIFLYYLLVFNRDKIEGMGSGTTFKEVSGKVMSNISVSLPSLPTQQKIANILSSLDDKIEVNRRINEQLEELAQALFTSWFVDFEPFKDGEFVESELGMIPKGWKVCELSDIGEIVGGATPSKANPEYYTQDGISWITPKDLSINKNKFIDKGETDITELGYSKCSAKLMSGEIDVNEVEL